MALPLKIKTWLNDRGITDAVIATHGLDWNGNQIVIPIQDLAGNFLFNKYRRDPFGPDDIPKYKYETGTTAQLFNAHKVPRAHFVIICEGEMDAMRLEVEGFTSVSSTGGAGTFKDEWLPLFKDKEVYVCFDNDEAGLKGATKLLTKLPARLVLIPREKDVKDITDFFKKHSSLDFSNLLTRAIKYPVLSEPLPEFRYIKDIMAQIKKYKYALEHLLIQERQAKNTGQSFAHFDYIRQLLLIAINNLERKIRRIKYLKKPIEMAGNEDQITHNDVARAKMVPLENLYPGKLWRAGYRATGSCPFHNEKNSSFTIYLQQNKFYCYGCSVGTDSIDYVMRRDECDFITAVKKLIKK